MVKFSFLICRSEFVCFSFFFKYRNFSVTSREIFPAIQFVSDSLIGQNISNLWNVCMVNHSRQSISSRFSITRDAQLGPPKGGGGGGGGGRGGGAEGGGTCSLVPLK